MLNIYELEDKSYGFGIHASTLEIYAQNDIELGKRASDGSGVFTPFLHLSRTGNIGIGSQDPERVLHIVGNGGIKDDIFVESINNGGGAEDAGTISPVSGGGIMFVRARGTPDAKMPPITNDSFAIFDGRGWNSTTQTYQTGAQIDVRAATDWAVEQSASMHFRARHAGDWATRMTISSDGNVGVGTTLPSHRLHVSGVARSTQANFATSSDARVKEDIEPLSDGLATLMRVRPVSFHYKPTYAKGKEGMDGLKRGFIAQEVEAVVPEMVTQAAEDIGDGETIDDFRILNNADFTPILVKAVQELKAENDSLRAANDNFRRELDELKAAIGD